MNADSIFMIGSTHSICQDYATSSNEIDSSYVIVSDGCSSSADTDIGARLLVRAATQLQSRLDLEISDLHVEAARIALSWARDVGLSEQAVDATLLTAHAHDGGLIIAASGDGVVVLESHLGTIEVCSISFPDGFPLYPAYEHQSGRLAAWRTNASALKEIRYFRSNEPRDSFDLVSTATSSSVTHTMSVDPGYYRHVVLISDGIHSFYKTERTDTSQHNLSLPMQDVLPEVIGFKSSHAAFVARRAKRFASQCELSGWHHADDLTVGAIYLGN